MDSQGYGNLIYILRCVFLREGLNQGTPLNAMGVLKILSYLATGFWAASFATVCLLIRFQVSMTQNIERHSLRDCPCLLLSHINVNGTRTHFLKVNGLLVVGAQMQA